MTSCETESPWRWEKTCLAEYGDAVGFKGVGSPLPSSEAFTSLRQQLSPEVLPCMKVSSPHLLKTVVQLVWGLQ